MNLLQEIAVTGTVFPTHARLSIQFTFHNPTAHPLSPTYLFPLPDTATITGMQILTGNKTLIRAEISAMSSRDIAEDGFRLVQLKPDLYSLNWECLPAGDTCSILIDCLLSLFPKQNRCRLVLPFGFSETSQKGTSPCPANLDLVLKETEPIKLSMQDSFNPETGIFSGTAQTDEDFVLDMQVLHPHSCGYLQESFGKGCVFARLFFPAEKLASPPGKTSVLLLLDLSRAVSLRQGNLLKELFFRVYSALPSHLSVQCITTGGGLLVCDSADQLYTALQPVPSGTGSTDELLSSAAAYQNPNTLTILVSDGTSIPADIPDFPLILITTGTLRNTALAHSLQGESLHLYPRDNPEDILPPFLHQLLSPKLPVEVRPESGTFHDCIILSPGSTLSDGYLDLAFAYSGHPPLGFSLWQDGQNRATCPLLSPETYAHFPDAVQLFARGKIESLERLLDKASPVSGRSIKRELAVLQTDARILGTETMLVIPTEEKGKAGISAKFYTASDGFTPISRPTIFGEGIRTLPTSQKEQLANRCRQTIYQSIRSDGSIHSPLGITRQVAAEETALSYLALFADGETNPVILQDALTYLHSAPKTPWSHLIQPSLSREHLQRLLPTLPDFEVLLASMGDSLPLMTANYLLLWLSLA